MVVSNPQKKNNTEGFVEFPAFMLQEEEDELCAGELVSVFKETGSHFFYVLGSCGRQ